LRRQTLAARDGIQPEFAADLLRRLTDSPWRKGRRRLPAAPDGE